MTTESFPICLLHKPTDTIVDAVLQTSIEEAQLEDWRNLWVPAREEGIKRCVSTKQIECIPQSYRWKWDKKIAYYDGILAKRTFSVVCNDRTEGLMLVTTPAFALEESQKGKPLVYVDFLETAPWNINGFLGQGEYRGVGSVLLRAAVLLSLQEEYQGRIGLQSLPDAEAFYSRLQMRDLGLEHSKEGLRYFEMTPIEANAFLTRGGRYEI
ncbi:hypothetical protein [Halodesulfovibrio sp.]|uniref:hypothetical protein n=1 Tax=Halodesulfovibrio sp. TaxID=1912772 RepID=UPI0025BC3691|nr:hypothetical protein [Halodesulfovibrio sp.]